MDYQASTSSKIIRNHTQLVKKLLVASWVLATVCLPSFAQVVAENPLTETVTITAEVLINPGTRPNNPPVPPSGPINIINITDVAIFKGFSSPGSTISVLKNGIVIGTVPVTSNGTFELHIQNLTPGTYTFGVRAEDIHHLTSKLLIFTVYLSSGIATVVDGIFMPPTITSDKVEVKKGDPITFSGMSLPNSEVRLSVILGLTPQNEVLKKTKANASGTWSYIFNSGELQMGDYFAKAKSLTLNSLSPYSDDLAFAVGATTRVRNKPSDLTGFRKRCDLNNDNRVNLLDFSIMAFWYKRFSFPPKVDLNTDNKVDLTDVSILAYCWTG